MYRHLAYFGISLIGGIDGEGRGDLKQEKCLRSSMCVPVNILCHLAYHVLYVKLRGKPTESIDGYYHRNKTIKFWSNGITCLYRKYMVYPLKDTFTIENGLLFV